MIIPGIMASVPYSIATGDPYWANVVLLAHFDGLNNQSSTVDSSSYARAIGLTGVGTTLTTAAKVFGESSIRKPGGTANINLAYTPELSLAGKSFSIEGWAQLSTSATENNATLIDFRGTSAFNTSWVIYSNRVNRFIAIYNGPTNSQPIVSANNVIPPLGTWFYYCVRRSSAGVVSIDIDGVTVGSALYNPPATHSSGIRIGLNQANGDSWNGWFDEWRWTVGVERYTSAAPIPASAFPDGP